MDRHERIEDQLAKVPLFSGLSKKELRLISQLATYLEEPAGTVLTEEGKPGHEFIIVLTGGASVTSRGREISALLAGDHFGDVALLDDGVSRATVVAQTPMTLAVVNPGEFAGLLDRCPTLARAVISSLATRVRAVAAA